MLPFVLLTHAERFLKQKTFLQERVLQRTARFLEDLDVVQVPRVTNAQHRVHRQASYLTHTHQPYRSGLCPDSQASTTMSCEQCSANPRRTDPRSPDHHTHSAITQNGPLQTPPVLREPQFEPNANHPKSP